MRGNWRITSAVLAASAGITAFLSWPCSSRAQQIQIQAGAIQIQGGAIQVQGDVQVQVRQPIQLDFDQIFDGGLFVDADVEIVNGRIMVKDNSKPREEESQPDPAGDQVLELTDGSQLHGKLISLGKGDVVWQRTDAKEPLNFSPQEIKRVVLSKSPPDASKETNATIKLHGSDWLAGNLTELRDGVLMLKLAGDTALPIPKEKVEWLSLAPQGKNPPDSYEGPMGPMGMAGWITPGESTSSWDYADGALVAKSVSSIGRYFAVLPEKVDIQFSAGDGGSSNRGLTLWLQPGTHSRGYTKGSCYLRFQAGTVNANIFSGSQMKNFSANIEEPREEIKVTRYRLLLDRKAGRMVVIINGKQVADWDLPEVDGPAVGGTFSWQPSYWSSNIAWTLSNVRVKPWDGDLVPDGRDGEEGKDLLKEEEKERKAGQLQEITGEVVKFSDTEVSRKTPLYLRLASGQLQEPDTGGIARVWLASRGEFDVSGIGFRDGMLKVRTSFGGDISLPASAVKAIEFPHKAPLAPPNLADGGDLIVFKNGDQLKGTLLSASHDKPLQWKPLRGDKPVEFAPDRLAGVLLAARKDAPAEVGGAAVRMHNGDWVSGKILGLDANSLRMATSFSKDVKFSRGAVRTLYFSPLREDGTVGETPVWDGASQRDLWMKGTAIPGYWGGETRRKEEKKSNIWRYMDGAFTLLSSGTRNGYNNGPSLGRNFETMPEKVEVSFQISTQRGPASYAFQLFFEENKPGLMVQGSWDSAYIYDMSPRRNGFNQPQQLEFGDKIGSEGNKRTFRFLGDRTTGRLWMYVNGHFVGQLNRRSGSENFKSGKGIAIMPQPMMSRITLSDLWVAPWSGAVPAVKKEKAAEKDLPKEEVGDQKPDGAADKPKEDKAGPGQDGDKPAAEKPEDEKLAGKTSEPMTLGLNDAIALNNGDEALGKVTSASEKDLRISCEVGDLDIPLNRAVMVEFGGAAPKSEPGIRLRLAGKGVITVQSFRIENGQVKCASTTAGEMSFPLAAVAEVVFQKQETETKPDEEKSADSAVRGQIPGLPIIRMQQLIR